MTYAAFFELIVMSFLFTVKLTGISDLDDRLGRLEMRVKAIENILQMAQLKQEGFVGKILVTGCLSQRYQQEIIKERNHI